MQDCSNSIANTLELLQSWTKTSNCRWPNVWWREILRPRDRGLELLYRLEMTFGMNLCCEIAWGFLYRLCRYNYLILIQIIYVGCAEEVLKYTCDWFLRWSCYLALTLKKLNLFIRWVQRRPVFCGLEFHFSAILSVMTHQPLPRETW